MFCPMIAWLLVVIGCALSPDLSAAAQSDPVREPRYAGTNGFYPGDPEQLRAALSALAAQAAESGRSLPAGTQLRALILPHAGYIYSGWTAAHGEAVLQGRTFEKVILIGPDHRIGFQNGSVSRADIYRTPLGNVRLCKDEGRRLEASGVFRWIEASDRTEHSLEVVLPFLQHACNGFRLLPLVLGPCDVGKTAREIEPMIDGQTLVVISSDLSHYLPYEEAVVTDNETLRIIEELDADELLRRPDRACGRYPIAVLLTIAGRRGWKPLVLHYSNSGDTAGNRSRVVGYAAIAFYGETAMETNDAVRRSLTDDQGLRLVRLARRTIRRELGLDPNAGDERISESAMEDEIFRQHRGTFVTLHKEGALRGCIGSLAAYDPLAASVEKNAVNAAFHDPRFPPLRADELDRLDIEVSILTTPQPLDYSDAQDLLAKLRVGVDGLIIRKGGASATFLPQVWKQLPNPTDFLSHLCMKAGLPSNAWKTMPLEVQTYQVQYFEETR